MSDHKHIALRAFQNEDRDIIRTWRNSPEISRYMYTDKTISIEDHNRWFESLSHDNTKKYWMITLENEPVGVANLADISTLHQRCFWAFYLAAPSVRGQGVGSYVEYFVLNYVFEELKLNKLCCEVLEFNTAVIEMHKRFGFKEEGVFRQHIFKNDHFVDVISLSMLRSEWLELKSALYEHLKAKNLI